MSQAFKWYVEVLGGEAGWQGDHGEYQCIKFGDTSITLIRTDEHSPILHKTLDLSYWKSQGLKSFYERDEFLHYT